MVEWDSLLSYQTYKIIRIHDRRLGLIHYSILLIVFAYIGLYVFWWTRSYFNVASSKGEVALKIRGSTIATVNGDPILFSSEDLINPSLEPGATFIATTILQTNDQVRGVCGDPDQPCINDGNCTQSLPIQKGTCLGGFCQAMMWCPSENVTSGATTQYNMQDSGALTIWMKATMSFPDLDATRVYNTVLNDQPVRTGVGKNLYSLDELLAMANTNYSTIQARGGIFLVKLIWECYLDSSTPCYPTVQTVRLDSPGLRSGFNYRYATMALPSTSGVDVRHQRKMLGVRLFFSSEGVGYQTSLHQIILQLSSGLALTAIATLITDFILQYIIPQHRKYQHYKVTDVDGQVIVQEREGSESDIAPNYGSIQTNENAHLRV